MDALGARYLAARLRAGVRVGTIIVLDEDDPSSGLRAGERGVVKEITLDGILVDWHQGLRLGIDPATTPYHSSREV